MSTIHTAIAPSFGGGGGGGKRGRDGDDGRDRRRPERPKPTDKIGAADFAPDGRIRQLVLLLVDLGQRTWDIPRGQAPRTRCCTSDTHANNPLA